MSRTATLLGGFVLGSVATLAVARLVQRKKKKKVSFQNDGNERRSRSLILPSGSTTARGAQQHVNFLSDMLARLWKHLNVAGSAMIRETVEPMFADMLPGPLASLRFTKVDLGNVPIRLDNIVVHSIKKDGEEETLQFDLDVLWDSSCDIRLKADYIGSFGVKSIQLKGRMTFLLKPLTDCIPCISAIQYAFINPPDLELDFTGLANIADFGGIDQSVRDVLQATLASMIVVPNRMLYKMDLGADFMQIYQPPLGVAHITAVGGRGFQVEKKALGRGDIPDVYCVLKVGDRVCKTSTVKDSLSPRWNETLDFVVFDHDQIIRLHAWDEDTGALDADDDLGSAEVTVGDLLLAGKTKELELQSEDEVATGAFVTIHCDICKFVSDATSLEESALAETKSNKHGLCGIISILVTQAFDVPVKKKDAASFVKVNYGDLEFATGVVVDAPGYDCLNPVYDCAFHVPLSPDLRDAKDEGFPSVVFTLVNGEKEMGVLKVTHASLLALPNKTMTEKRQIGGGGASLEFRVQLAGVEQKEASNTVPDVLPANTGGSMGNVRVTLLSGHGFKGTKKKRFGKPDIPDVYCKIRFGSSPTAWRTATVKDSVAPSWKEEKKYVLSNHNQVLHIDAFDANRKGLDDELGSARVTVGTLLLNGGPTDVELESNGVCTGAFVRVNVERLN